MTPNAFNRPKVSACDRGETDMIDWHWILVAVFCGLFIGYVLGVLHEQRGPHR